MKKGKIKEESRVVNINGNGHQLGDIQWNDPYRFNI